MRVIIVSILTGTEECRNMECSKKKPKKQTKQLCSLVFRKQVCLSSLSKACLFVNAVSWKRSELHRV